MAFRWRRGRGELAIRFPKELRKVIVLRHVVKKECPGKWCRASVFAMDAWNLVGY